MYFLRMVSTAFQVPRALLKLEMQELNDHSRFGLMGGQETIRDEESDQDDLLRMPGATLPGMIGSHDRAVVSTTQHSQVSSPLESMMTQR
jgi:hypothetical protein